MYKIKLIQENPKVGDIKGNLDLAKSHIIEAKEKGISLIVFSEMFLTGYPPEDLLLRDDFIEESERCSKELEELSKEISIIIGCPSRVEKNIFNSALFYQKGKIVKNYKKQILPNYKEFDEKRLCSICQHLCFFSAVVCSCDPDRVACLRHHNQLCKCNRRENCFLFWYIIFFA